MSNKLRDLIKAVRACKTAAEERAIVAKESAAIRSAIKENEEGYRHRNVAKLLYIHMLGYPTHWGQMECVKLLASQFYSDKRIGYLALMLLLDENQEVLTLVTNSIKNDLNNANQFITGLALCALGNVSSAGMVRDLAPEVEKLLGSTNPYIRKKAALCAIRVLRKCPDLMENFVPRIRALLSEKSHGVLLTGVTLMIELCETDSHNIDYFKKLVSSLVRILKNLVMSGYAPEYDVSGITDPFLQVKILRLLRYLGKGDSEASDQMNDVLAQIATNTDHSRNVGNAILYECVQTILSIEAENGLRVLAINVLGKFLLNRDNNIRYVALTTLTKVVTADIDAVQRHRNTIVDCLKDPDLSIRRRALDLIYALVDDSNIKVLAHELLSFLQSANPELRPDLAVKLCNVTERFSPNKRWHVDTILRIMSIAGNHVPDETSSTLLNLIASSSELHSYAVQKMFLSISNDYQQQRLVQVASWTIGEFGDLLVSSTTTTTQEISVSEKDVLDLLEKIIKSPTTTAITKEYILTALMKLSSRFNTNSIERIKSIISYYKNNIDVEIQARACEYSSIFKWESIRQSLLERIPVVVDDKSSITRSTEIPVNNNTSSSSVNNNTTTKSLIDDWEAEMLGPSTTTSKPVSASTSGTTTSSSTPGDDLMAALFGPSPTTTTTTTTPTPVVPPVATTNVDPLAELFGGPTVVSPPVQPVNTNNNIFGTNNVGGQIAPIVAFQKNGLTITFDVSKQPNAPNVTSVNTIFANSLSYPIQNFEFKVAVPKYIKLQVNPPTSNILPPNSNNVTQSLKTMNTLQHEGKPLLMKLKIDYVLNGQPVSEFGDVTFPSNV